MDLLKAYPRFKLSSRFNNAASLKKAVIIIESHRTTNSRSKSTEKMKILIAIRELVMIAINIFSWSRFRFPFLRLAPELLWVFNVRVVQFGEQHLRFVGAPDDVAECLACYYRFVSQIKINRYNG